MIHYQLCHKIISPYSIIGGTNDLKILANVSRGRSDELLDGAYDFVTFIHFSLNLLIKIETFVL